MDFSFNNSVWQAQNLPEGFSFNGGILSGSANSNGSFTVPITVTTDFGSDTKNITINVRARPGSDKFSILQNGTEIEKVSIPQLVASIRDGSAQNKYNCTNTQLILPVSVPYLFWAEDSHRRNIFYDIQPHSINAALNFCDFQNVTLSDDSVVPALILQFEQTLWWGYSCFDYFDSNQYFHNRWKFSSLRQWLNSSGLLWFTPAYQGDDISLWMLNEDDSSLYLADDSVGFLSLMPDDFVEALTPIKVITSVYWDYANQFIHEPELIDNIDCDITFDKVFIPALSQMAFSESDSDLVHSVEGTPWAFYSYIRQHNLWEDISQSLLEDNIRSDNIIPPSAVCCHISRTPYNDSPRFSLYVDNKGQINRCVSALYERYLPAPAFALC